MDHDDRGCFGFCMPLDLPFKALKALGKEPERTNTRPGIGQLQWRRVLPRPLRALAGPVYRLGPWDQEFGLGGVWGR